MMDRALPRALPRALRVAIVLACAAALGLAGCKPKEGATCKEENRELCAGESQALACHDGMWVAMACRGKSGCDKIAGCDQSAAEAGEVCNLESDFVCSADKTAMLECKKHRWVAVQTCKGERGCAIDQGKVSCDNTTASVGDPCRDEDDHACAPDKSAALVCRSGKFEPAALCRGPKACRVVASKEGSMQVACDDSVAAPGDPCEPEGHYACALDGRSILRCKDRKFAQDDACKPKESCQVRGDQVGCYPP